MGQSQKFILDCFPTPQARVRHAVRNGVSMSYKAKTQKENEKELDVLIRQFKPVTPMEKPVAIFIKVFLPIPRSVSKKFRLACQNDKMPVPKKPDLDNYVKNILDCMTRAQFWRDDSQVAILTSTKTYSEHPRWEIEYNEIEV